jgi:ABC-type transport system involved in multi-copper enzyme maturation permease subunit
MTVRDLGYRAYEGELLPASHNTWVLFRYGFWRIWGSWINKIVVFPAVLPVLGYIILAVVRYAIVGREMPDLPPEAGGEGSFWVSTNSADWLRPLTALQFWFFVSVVTTRSGAGVIAEDFSNRAYQFYFSKPVTWVQYLAGRMSALALFLFLLIFVPTALLAITLAALGPLDAVVENMGVILPAMLDAAIIAVSCSVLSVAISALSKSRALTMTAWVVLFFVPFVLARIVETITDSEWMYVISLPGLLYVIGDALYKVETNWQQLQWYHALPVLAAMCAGGLYFAATRIRKAEVIT